MIISTKYLGPTDTRGGRVVATVSNHGIETIYRATYDYHSLIGDGSTYAHRAAAHRILAEIGADSLGPVLVDAGIERSTRSGERYAVLNGPASLRAAETRAANLGVAASSLVCPVSMLAPAVPEDDDRVELVPGLWPHYGRHAVVLRRIGKYGTRFHLRIDDGRETTLGRAKFL